MSETDIALVFARDPLEHTDEDITKIIEHYREKRKLFKLGGEKPPAKLTKREAEVKSSGLSLKDLDI